MAEYPDSETFVTQLDEQDIRASQLVVVGLVLGAVMFLLVIGLLYFLHSYPEQAPTDPPLDSLYSIFSMAALFSVIPAYIAGAYLMDKKLKEDIPASKFLEELRSANILRIAPAEGAAFLGLVSFQLIIMDDLGPALLSAYPWLWLNLLPVVLLVYIAAQVFPTREKIKHRYEEYLATRSLYSKSGN